MRTLGAWRKGRTVVLRSSRRGEFLAVLLEAVGMELELVPGGGSKPGGGDVATPCIL
jgi:hypothetical protein